MAYTALKPCRFAGQSYKVGESVPAAALQPGAAKNLVKMGIIAAEGTELPTAQKPEPIKTPKSVNIALRTEEGDLPLEVTPEGIQSVFDALTATVAEAAAIIEGMTDGDALILLNASDKRKSIQEATETRAKALSAPAEG